MAPRKNVDEKDDEKVDVEESDESSDASVVGFIAEDVKAAHKAAKEEAKDAGVTPSAVMYSAPEGYGNGVEPVVMGEGSAAHGDFSDWAKAEKKRVADEAKADKEAVS